MTHWVFWMVAGVLSLIAGAVAFANPFAATLTVELLAGSMFLLVGIITLFSAFQDQGWGARIWAIFLGAFLTIFGFNLIGNPLGGVLTLTLAVAILMGIMGIVRLILGLSPAAAGARLPLIVSGLISVVLAGMIFADFPFSAAVVLGIFLGIELVSNGVSLIAIALVRRAAGDDV